MNPVALTALTVLVIVLIVIPWQYRVRKLKRNAAEGKERQPIAPGLWVVLAVVAAVFIVVVVVMPLFKD